MKIKTKVWIKPNRKRVNEVIKLNFYFYFDWLLINALNTHLCIICVYVLIGFRTSCWPEVCLKFWIRSWSTLVSLREVQKLHIKWIKSTIDFKPFNLPEGGNVSFHVFVYLSVWFGPMGHVFTLTTCCRNNTQLHHHSRATEKWSSRLTVQQACLWCVSVVTGCGVP